MRLIFSQEFPSSKCVLYLGASYFRAASYLGGGGGLNKFPVEIAEQK